MKSMPFALSGLSALLLLFAIDGAFLLAADPVTGPLGADIVAHVADTPIYRSELEAVLRRLDYEQLTGAEQQLRAQAEALGALIDQRLLRMTIEREKITTDELEVTAVMKRRRPQPAQPESDRDTLLSNTQSEEQLLRSQIALEICLNKLIAPLLTKESLATTYTKHRRAIDGTRLRVSHIVLRPDPGMGADAIPTLIQRAEGIRRAILQRDLSFSDAAKKFSAGPSRKQDGDLGFFPRRGVMVEDFSRVAFQLAKGDVSSPVVTPFGVHLLTVTGMEPGAESFEALRPQVENILIKECVGNILSQARARTSIVFSPGVPHFEPRKAVDDQLPPTVIVSPQ